MPLDYWNRREPTLDVSRYEKSGTSIDQWWADFGPSSTSAGGIPVTQLSALQVSTVMACVSILAEDVAKLPVHVYRRQTNGAKVVVDDHPVERLLQRPNNFQSRFEFFEQMQAAEELRGNSYAPVIKDNRGTPRAWIPVNPDLVWIYEAPDGSVFYMVARRGQHDIAMLESLPLMVPAEDMFHLRWLSLDNSLWGSSRIGLAREVIGLALSQQELAGRLAANNTNLGGILQTDQKLGKDVAERLAKDWKEKKAGLRNAGETAVLEQGLKWQAMGMTAQDAEFIASRNLQVLEICRLFRMPPHKVGVMEKSIGASIEQLDQDYMNSTVSSRLERWEAKIDQTFGLAEQDLFVEFDTSRLLRASMLTRFNAYRAGISSGVLTPNQASRAEGLPDDPDGDVRFRPANMVPLGTPAGPLPPGPGSDTTGSPAEGGDGDPAVPDAAPDA